MKKLKLEHYNIKDAEILTREQLKSILGGDGSGYDGSCTYRCPDGNTECTSPTGNCSRKKEGVVVVSISCDGITYDC